MRSIVIGELLRASPEITNTRRALRSRSKRPWTFLSSTLLVRFRSCENPAPATGTCASHAEARSGATLTTSASAANPDTATPSPRMIVLKPVGTFIASSTRTTRRAALGMASGSSSS